VKKPGEGVGNGLGFEVVGHGGKVGPGGVTTEEFDDAGAEHQSGNKEPESPAKEAGWGIGSGGAGEDSGFFKKDEKESGFEKEGIPLKREEVLTNVDEGEPAEP